MIIRNMGQRLFMTQEQIDDCVGIDWDNPTAFIEAELKRVTIPAPTCPPPANEYFSFFGERRKEPTP